MAEREVRRAVRPVRRPRVTDPERAEVSPSPPASPPASSSPSPTPSPAQEEEQEKKEELPLTKAQLFREGLGIHWRFFFTFIWPALCCLIFIFDTTVSWRCAYVVLLMAGYWVTEVLPLGITGLLPVLLFPLMNILDTDATCALYMNNTNMMLLVSICIAFAIENSNLHRRIALKLILLIGTTHYSEPYPSRTTLCYFFGIAYSSTIGGVGTLIGTGTNYVFKGIYEEFPKAPPIDFADWIASQFPMVLIMGFLTWVGLCWQFLGMGRKSGMDELVRKQKLEDREGARAAADIALGVVRERYEALGRCTWAELWVLFMFLLALALWITRDPSWMRGWGPQITPLKVKDACPGVLILIVFFVVPLTPSLIYCMNKDPDKRPRKAMESILTWYIVKTKYMWGLLLLVGGGFALSKAMVVSGMSKGVGDALGFMRVLHPLLILVIVCFMASMFTEFTSNVAACNILVPIVAELAVTVQVNPILLMLPACLCVSFSFMLPVGTPPNALIAGYAHIRTKDMFVAGLLPTLITLVVVVVLFPTYGSLIYHTDTFPSWARGNSTT